MDDSYTLMLFLLDEPPAVAVVNDVAGVVGEGGDHRHLMAQRGQFLGQLGHDDRVGSDVRGKIQRQEKETQRSLHYFCTR